MEEKEMLSWEDLANFYQEKTGSQARIKPMNDIYDWAVEQPEIIVNKDTSLSFVKERV